MSPSRPRIYTRSNTVPRCCLSYPQDTWRQSGVSRRCRPFCIPSGNAPMLVPVCSLSNERRLVRTDECRSCKSCLSERSPTQRDTRHPVQLGAVATVAGVPPTQVAAVADVFRHPDRSFITPSADVTLHPDTVLDIS